MGSGFRVSGFLGVLGSGFRVSGFFEGFGFGVSGFGFRRVLGAVLGSSGYIDSLKAFLRLLKSSIEKPPWRVKFRVLTPTRPRKP